MLNKQFFARALSGALLALLVSGSMRAQRRNLTLLSQTQSTRSVEFDIFLPLENGDQLDKLLAAQHTPGSANYHKWLTPQQFQTQFGPNPAAFSRVASELASYGFTVMSTHSQGMHVSGSVAAVRREFGVTLWTAATASGRQRIVATEALKLPATLQKLGVVTSSFLPTVEHRVHSKSLGAVPYSSMRAAPFASGKEVPDNRYSKGGPYWFTDIRQAYQFPSYQFLTGKGINIGIVIDSDVLDSDLEMYLGHENVKPPALVRRPVLGGPAAFNPNDGSAGEASLDVQQSGGMAPGSTINLYDVPDLSDNSVLAAYETIIDDNVVDVVSSSFGLGEQYYTAAYNFGIDITYLLRIYHNLFQQGNAQGITFVASSGDEGGFAALSLDLTRYIPSVSNPASDPDVTGVGGTNLVTNFTIDNLNSTYRSENALYDSYDPALGALPNEIWGSGGGKSIIFAKPSYQLLVDTGADTRAVPDISMQMGGCPVGSTSPCPDDRSSAVVAIGGVYYQVIGTSIGAPEIAGLLALAEENIGSRLGNANVDLYGIAAAQQKGLIQAFQQGIPSDNGAFQSPSGQTGYNMIIGNGTPIGINLIGTPTAPVAGTPGSPSN